MKKMLLQIAALTAIAAVCAALLAVVSRMTEEPIEAAAAKAEEAAVRAVLPQSAGTVRQIGAAPDGRKVFAGMAASGETVGYALSGSDPSGYGGRIKLMVGFTPDFKVVSYRKLEAAETPGLGAKLTSPKFSDQFAGKDAAAGLKVTKDGGEIVPITAATITSRAVCGAVDDACKALQAHLKAAGAPPAAP